MANPFIVEISARKIRVTRAGVRSFNTIWPCAKLRPDRSYWFEFDRRGDLVGTDVPEQDDGPEAAAMADDCREYLLSGQLAAWAQE